MSSPKLSLHQCLRDIAIAERKRKLTTNVATFLRRCALAHLSEDPDEAANAMEGVVDMAVAALPSPATTEHKDVSVFAAHLRKTTPTCCSNVKPTTRTAATSFVAVTCSDSEDEDDARAPQSAGTVD